MLVKKVISDIWSAFEKLKQKLHNELIASVPVELAEQYNQMQLEKTVFRLKILCGVLLSGGILYSVFGYLPTGSFLPDRLREHLDGYLRSGLVLPSLPALLALIYFHKKKNYRVLWIVCHIFILLCFFIIAAYIYSVGTSFHLIHLTFVLSIFMITFFPEFKPKVFLAFVIAYFAIMVCIFTYRHQTGSDEYITDLFFVFAVSTLAGAAKLWLYNNGIKMYTYISQILELNARLMALSETDELTKLNNRRSFLNYMDIIWKQSHRLSLPINALMIDVDYFKKYNDSMGHLEGDKALIAVAQCLKTAIKRETDFAARYGGEEFVVLLPYVERSAALDFAKTLVQNIEDMQIPHPASEVSKYVTISAGLASIIPNDNNTSTQLLDKADQALYTAKQSGRNRVIAVE
jgi:diguanylate cyclase (GGDEF)-like protein